jgi:hypothetical protein
VQCTHLATLNVDALNSRSLLLCRDGLKLDSVCSRYQPSAPRAGRHNAPTAAVESTSYSLTTSFALADTTGSSAVAALNT